ncbi:hypothetical protein F9U64_10495 [Gracilibacillus oryzae]|uniref:Uncharacterized protein n=1 Tax=Gracilibacillus oryzae TaxID=1672701 RepID=A0A7C8GT81_9BACI|nr:hypothetical protein F9U64_10495 [Gracilibacillus oryzae]
MKLKDYEISFEQISESKTKEVQLRIIVNISSNATDLLIFPHADSKAETLQIDFKNYITYSVIYDDYTNWNDDEVFRGDSFRIYEKSKFFDFVQKEYRLPDYELTHYSLACIEHHVHIISKSPPVIKVIDPDE